MKPFEIVSDEGLEIIEHNAETILEEVGVEIRDYPSALQVFADAGADVDGTGCASREGMCRQIVQASAPREYIQHARNPRAQRADRRRRHGVRAQLRLAVRLRPRQRPPLRDDRRLPQLRQAHVPVAVPAPSAAARSASRSTSRSASVTSTWCTPTCATATSRSWARSPRPSRAAGLASSWPASRSAATSPTAP